MKLLWRWRRSDSSVGRTEVKNLEQQLTLLRARLSHTRLWLAAAAAVAVFLPGLVLVVDERPLKWAINMMAFGVSQQLSEVDAAYAAYIKDVTKWR
jgi:hypothetical protein